jgi:hypothetical protein
MRRNVLPPIGGKGLTQIKPKRGASSPLKFEPDITVAQHVAFGSSRLFGKAAQCLLSSTADALNNPSVFFYPEHIHHPLHRGVAPILHLDPAALSWLGAFWL